MVCLIGLVMDFDLGLIGEVRTDGAINVFDRSPIVIARAMALLGLQDDCFALMMLFCAGWVWLRLNLADWVWVFVYYVSRLLRGRRDVMNLRV